MLPEERVRQSLLQHLVQQLGYPKSYISVEKALDGPNRRYDVLVYGKCHGELKPLLLIECKAEHVTEEAVQQALGYNHEIDAPFVAAVGYDRALMITGNGELVGGLLAYQELMEKVRWN